MMLCSESHESRVEALVLGAVLIGTAELVYRLDIGSLPASPAEQMEQSVYRLLGHGWTALFALYKVTS